jgi:ribosomal-protein-alanine N-acetyltransferase
MNEIETERLRLRLFRPNDLDDLSLIFSNPDVVRHLGSGQPASREETETALCSIIRHWDVYGFGRWAAILKSTQKLIGYCGLRSFQGTPELVYLLAKEYWGMGLATEMARTSLRYGFEERKFERIIALTKLANVASQRVMRKIGMSFQKNAVIFNMQVACYSISRVTYLSKLGNDTLARAGSAELAEPCVDFNFDEKQIHSLSSLPELETEMVSR